MILFFSDLLMHNFGIEYSFFDIDIYTFYCLSPQTSVDKEKSVAIGCYPVSLAISVAW